MVTILEGFVRSVSRLMQADTPGERERYTKEIERVRNSVRHVMNTSKDPGVEKLARNAFVHIEEGMDILIDAQYSDESRKAAEKKFYTALKLMTGFLK